MNTPRAAARPRFALSFVALTASACGPHASALPFTEVQALCAALLPQVSGDGACRMDELAAPTRSGAEPQYDVTVLAVFRTNGRLDTYREMRASGPAADPSLPPADCAARAVRGLSVPERTDTLTLPLKLQYRESDAITPAASVQPGGQCTLTIPVRAP
jgi:hypothetical protein